MLSTYWVFFFGPADLGSGPGPTRDPFGYPKYPQIIVYTRYIWVIGYIFGISDFFKSFGFGFSGIIVGFW